jgi:hypothetical protein
MTEYTPTDSLRYLEAYCADILGHVSQQLCRPPGEAMSEDETEHLLDRLDAVREALREQLSAHTDQRHTYDDGRPVQSAVEIADRYTCPHTWHPDRAHEVNQPHVVIRDLECPSGARVTVMVTGDECERLAVYQRI